MYIKRDRNNNIVAVSLEKSAECTELLDPSSTELAEFLQRCKAPEQQRFVRSDLEMARVMEDLIYLLIDKQVIRFTDLPAEAQAKLNTRDAMRKPRHAIDLLDDGDDLDI